MNVFKRYARSVVLWSAGLLLGTNESLAQGGQPSLVSVTFAVASVTGGTSTTATILLSGPAGNNGTDVTLTIAPSVAQVGSTAITIGNGSSSATVSIATTPTATSQTVTLSATARGVSRTATLTVLPPAVQSLVVAPTAVTAGDTALATVTINGPAPAGGMIVSTRSSLTSVTSQTADTVPAGQTTTSYVVRTHAVTSLTSVTLTATTGSVSKSAPLSVAPAVGIVSISLPSSVAAGQQAAIRLIIDRAAPAGGAFIKLSSTGAEMFRTSSIDTIPAGDTIHLHTFSVPVVNIQTAFTITATSGASQRTLNGMVPAPHIAGITLRDTAASGTTQSAMLFLTARVPSSGLPVTFGSSSPIVESTSSPFISGGQSAALLLRIGVVTQATVVELTFGLNGSTHHKTLTVLPPQLSAFSASPTTVHPGSSVTLTATLTAAAPAGGRRVLIAAPGAPAFPPLPSIFVPAGATSGSSSFSLANLGLPASIQVNLTATLDQVSKTVVVTVTP